MALIAGTLNNASGVRPNTKIILTAYKTTSDVVTLAPDTTIVTSATGTYSFDCKPSFYNVRIQQSGYPCENVGIIQVYPDSPTGTINDFLTVFKPDDLTPEILKQCIAAMEGAEAAQKASESAASTAAEATAQKVGLMYPVNAGNWSTVAGSQLTEADRYKAWSYPDNSSDRYAVRGSVTLPITIPAAPDANWYLASSVNLTEMRTDSASQLGLVYKKGWLSGDVIPIYAMRDKLAYWHNGQFYSVGTDAGFTSNDFAADLAAGRFVRSKYKDADDITLYGAVDDAYVSIPNAVSLSVADAFNHYIEAMINPNATDNTQIIIDVLTKNGRAVIPNAPKGFMINDLVIPVGATLVGIGGDSYPDSCWEGEFTHAVPLVPRLVVPANGKGVSSTSTNNGTGGYAENLYIEGTFGSDYGFKALGMGFNSSRISVNNFPNGRGAIVSKQWRNSHKSLRIYNCGLSLHIDGTDGPCNGVHFDNFVAEKTRCAIYQTKAGGGLPSIANTFTSPIIEAVLGSNAYPRISWPVNVTLDPKFTADTNMTTTNVIAGVILASDAGFNFTSPYFEAVDGPHFWQAENSKILLNGGILESGSNQFEAYTGIRNYFYRGVVTSIGVRYSYKTNDSSALFSVNSNADNVFLGNKFDHDRSLREYYVDGYGNDFIYTNGYYQERQGQPIAIKTTIGTYGPIFNERANYKQKKYGTITASGSVDISDSIEPQRLIVTSTSTSAINVDIKAVDLSKYKDGDEIVLMIKCFSSGTLSTITTISFTDNIVARNVTITNDNKWITKTLRVSTDMLIEVSSSEVEF